VISEKNEAQSFWASFLIFTSCYNYDERLHAFGHFEKCLYRIKHNRTSRTSAISVWYAGCYKTTYLAFISHLPRSNHRFISNLWGIFSALDSLKSGSATCCICGRSLRVTKFS